MTRQYMIDFRQTHLMTIKDAAVKAGCSCYTLENIEHDDQYVTHPNIAARIAKVYKLTRKQYLSMIPENYRPGPDYDPDRYVEDERSFGTFSIRTSESYYSQAMN